MKVFRNNKYNLLSKFAKYSFVFMLAFYFLVVAISVKACDPRTDSGCQPDTTATNNTQPDTTATNGLKINGGIKNPLSAEFGDIPHFITAIINFVLLIGIPIIALAIIYSGFLFVTAQGNSEKLGKAKKTLLYTLIGAALLLGASVIADAIKGTVDQITNTQ